jgi:hypothetical protein
LLTQFYYWLHQSQQIFHVFASKDKVNWAGVYIVIIIMI